SSHFFIYQNLYKFSFDKFSGCQNIINMFVLHPRKPLMMDTFVYIDSYVINYHTLEFSTFRSSRERNHVSDVCHSGYEKHKSFKTKSETTVNSRSETSRI